MARKLKPDKLLFFATLALLSVSVIMVYSASALLAMDRYARPYYFLFRQVTWAVMGFGLLWGVMRFDYRRLRKPAVLGTAIGVTVLALVAVLFSEPINGTRRWFGIAGFGVQPSELAKIALILFAAAQLERRMERVNDIVYALLPLGCLTAGLTALILLQPDFSTALAVVVIVAAMVFAAGLKLPLRDRGGAGARARPVWRARDGAVSHEKAAGVSGPVGRSARRRVSGHPGRRLRSAPAAWWAGG